MTEEELREKIAECLADCEGSAPITEKHFAWAEQILTLIKGAGWKSPDKCSERKDVLLKATYDLLKKCDNSPFVVDVFSEIVFYDEADCDGYCLMEDIKNELRIDDE